MKTIAKLFRRSLRPFWHEAKRDDGILALVIAIALIAGAAALIAASARQNKNAEVVRQSDNAKTFGLIKKSALGYFLSLADGSATTTPVYALPCPDTDMPPDGTSDEVSGVCVGDDETTATYKGVIPWLTLRMSQADAIDSYGNYFTYFTTSVGRNLCDRVTNDYDGSISFDGSVIDATDTEALLTSETPGNNQGVPFYFATISHGPNGRGAISPSGTARAAPSSALENQNCPSNNTDCAPDSANIVLYSGPKKTTETDDNNSGASDDYFDDTVYLAELADVESICKQLTTRPPDGTNSDGPDIDTDFNSGLPSSLSTAVSTGTGSVTVTDSQIPGRSRALTFSGDDAALSTAPVNFDPLARPNYIAFEWTPILDNGAGDRAGIGLGLRATTADRTAGTAIFDNNTFDGLTINYFRDVNDNSDGMTANFIYICDQSTPNCSNASNLAISTGDDFFISLLETYQVEAYDDGVQIWGRITQVDDPTNTATIRYTVPVARQDLRGQSAIVFLSYVNSTSELDNLVIRRGGMAAAFDGTGDIIDTGADRHDTASGDLTLEAWVKPDSLPTGTDRVVIIGKWVEGGTTAAQSYRLYLNSDGVTLDIAGENADEDEIVANTFAFNTPILVDRWTHLAATYNRMSQTATLYVDGRRMSRIPTAAFSEDGVNNSTANFTVGANRNSGSAVVDGFDGQITDVRVWSTVRQPAEVTFNRKKRLRLSDLNAAGVDDDLTGLIVNWTLDRDTNALFASPTAGVTQSFDASASDTAAATGTFTNAIYEGIEQNFIPPNANTVCGVGTRARAFSCDYRTVPQSGTRTIPNNLASIFVKAWGGGGGGYDRTFGSSGGGAGMSAGRIFAIDTAPLPALTIRVDVAAGGTGTTAANNGAGGGGASGLWRDLATTGTLDANDRAGVVAGGGGGASYGDDNLGSGLNCDGIDDCGPGGIGGGPSNISGLTSVATSRAVDDNDNTCGGRGGDNTTFTGTPDGSDANCENGGDDPTSTSGASGAGVPGGSSVLGSGGGGFNGTGAEIGAGGAGGGVRLVTMTSGGGEAGGYDDETGLVTNGSLDANGTGFGGGGGAGFVDNTVGGAFAGSANAFTAYGNSGGFRSDLSIDSHLPGNVSGVSTTTDPDVAPIYCNSGANCIVEPGYGGQIGGENGNRGTVLLKW